MSERRCVACSVPCIAPYCSNPATHVGNGAHQGAPPCATCAAREHLIGRPLQNRDGPETSRPSISLAGLALEREGSLTGANAFELPPDSPDGSCIDYVAQPPVSPWYGMYSEYEEVMDLLRVAILADGGARVRLPCNAKRSRGPTCFVQHRQRSTLLASTFQPTRVPTPMSHHATTPLHAAVYHCVVAPHTSSVRQPAIPRVCAVSPPRPRPSHPWPPRHLPCPPAH